MKRLLALLPFLALATACAAPDPGPPQVSVENAVVTVPAVPGGMGAAYFTIRTNWDNSVLKSVTSPAIGSIDLHTSVQEGGRSGMRPLRPEEARFGPDTPLAFAPGAKHGMVMGLDPSLKPGDKVPLTFTVEPASPVTVEAEVRAPGQAHSAH